MKSLIALTLAAALSSAALAQRAQPPAQTESQRSPSTATQQAAPAVDLGQIFDRLNTSHTGKMTKDEAQAHPAVAANFDAADTNHDGVLTKEEFLAAFRPAQ
jgi:hypothetical protein